MYSITLNALQAILSNNQNLREIIEQASQNWHYTLSEDLGQRSYTDLSYNSKAVGKDSLFFCKGASFKPAYLAEAIENGATAYVSEVYYEDIDATAIIVDNIRSAMADIARAFYEKPDEKLNIIGITGTKGKTTSAYMLKAILDEASPGQTGLISTIEVILDGQTSVPATLTTPEALDLYQMLAQAAENQMTNLVMEVSSQAYKMDRVHGLTFDIGAFLNISPDHIGPNEHPDAEDYFHCKSRLLTNSKTAIINTSLDHLPYLLEVSQASGASVITYGQDEELSDIYFTQDPNDSRYFDIHQQAGVQSQLTGRYRLDMLGAFNKENALFAAIAASELGIDQTTIQTAIQKVQVEGRMQHYTYGSNHIYVDFAHNYISLKNLFDFAQSEHPDHQMQIVLGAPGNKGVSRRRDMGELLSLYEGEVILTEDDPNFEEVQDISKEIAAAIDGPIKVSFNDDRQAAIESLLDSLQPDDHKVILLAAKGSDRFILRRGVKEAYIGDHGLVETFLKNTK